MSHQSAEAPETVLSGFLLTGDSEDVKGRSYLRFFGISNSGPFELILTDHQPSYYIGKEADRNCTLGIARLNTELRSLEGKPVDRLRFANAGQARLWKERLSEISVTTYESDLKLPEKYLMDREIFAQVRLSSPRGVRSRAGLTQWIDPKVEPVSEKIVPKLSLLSLDIETGKQGQLFSIALHFVSSDRNTTFHRVLICKQPAMVPAVEGIDVESFATEAPLLKSFLQYVSLWDPDAVIGWNVVGFDLAFLLKKMNTNGIAPILGRNQGKLRIFGAPGGHGATVNGRLIIDVPKALRLNFFSYERFTLDHVAREVLGEGKLIESEQGKWDEIERQYYEEPEALVRYNMQDAELVTRIVEKTGIMDLLVKRSMISGMLVPKVGGSTAAFDHQMIPAMHRAGFVAPELADVRCHQSAKGGHVFSSDAGLHRNVVVLDFRSLYPSIIKTFNIDPLSLITRDKDPLQTPLGINFSRSHHALPGIITRLLEERAHAKASGDQQLSQAVKILMNSFYGVMGSKGCRFYHSDLPTAITGIGRYILESSKVFLEETGYRVIYGDTDSVFVRLKDEEVACYWQSGARIAESLTNYFQTHFSDDYGVESYLEMQYEKYYRDFFLPPYRGPSPGEQEAMRAKGSKKRYAGVVVDRHNREELIFTGMEFVRSDWTTCAKRFQWELYRRLFSGESVDDWLRSWVTDLRRGVYDNELIYQKRLTKPPEEYTKTKPPHVRATLKFLEKFPGGDKKLIRYLMTADGPTPEEFKPKSLDYQHYIEKQLKPIADTVLPYFATSFDAILGEKGHQPLLF